MGRKTTRQQSTSLTTLVRAETAAEDEILQVPALSSLQFHETNDITSDDNDDLVQEDEDEIERQLVQEQKEFHALNTNTNTSIYNHNALLSIVSTWNDSKSLPWVETLETCKVPIEITNVHDDLKREVSFYNHTIASVRLARERLHTEKIPYKRPGDYFAEMLKSDAHMAKVKDKLIYEQKKITAVDERKKSQAHRRVAKEIQAEKVKQRLQSKKETLEAVKQWKKRKNRDKSGLQDDDNAQLDSIMNGNINIKRTRTKEAQDSTTGRKIGRNKEMALANRKRQMKDQKFGFGGKKRYAKSNTKESTNDFRDFPGAKKRSGGYKSKGGKAVRPGKDARNKQRSKGGKR